MICYAYVVYKHTIYTHVIYTYVCINMYICIYIYIYILERERDTGGLLEALDLGLEAGGAAREALGLRGWGGVLPHLVDYNI